MKESIFLFNINKIALVNISEDSMNLLVNYGFNLKDLENRKIQIKAGIDGLNYYLLDLETKTIIYNTDYELNTIELINDFELIKDCIEALKNKKSFYFFDSLISNIFSLENNLYVYFIEDNILRQYV